MNHKRSPLAPDCFPNMPQIAGIDMWVAETGVKYKGRPDVLLVSFAPQSTVAGVFTKSVMPGAPVDWAKQCLERQANGGLLVNAGNANVFTGRKGNEDVRAMAEFAGASLRRKSQEVYVCSTGVIGEPLDLGPIKAALMSNSLRET